MRWLVAIALLGAACRGNERGRAQESIAPAPSATAPADAAPPMAPCAQPHARRELMPGLMLEHVRAEPASPAGIGDRCLVLVRADPARFELRLLTAQHDGGARPIPRWAGDFDLVAATNASMFHDDLRSTGLAYDAERRSSERVNAKFGAFLMFDPVEGHAPAMFGQGCPGFDLAPARRRYRAAVQNYRLLDCDGAAIAWKDEKIYSAAAIGLDRDGWIVFAHMRTPYLMKTFAEILAAPSLRLAAAMFVEGGPEATLHVRAAGTELTAIGSYETNFNEHDDNDRAWDIPNVIGLARR